MVNLLLEELKEKKNYKQERKNTGIEKELPELQLKKRFLDHS